MPQTALRELRILFAHRHPNVVSLLAVARGKQADSIFLVFEYCEHDLARLVGANGLPFTGARRFARRDALALLGRGPPPPPSARGAARNSPPPQPPTDQSRR